MTGWQHFADGFGLPETPRWRNGELWISDMWAHTVWRFDEPGARTLVHRFADDDPGGLGWLPNGDLLVVGMEGRCVYRLAPGTEPQVHADLSAFTDWPVNDMIVRDDGTAWVSGFGYDMWHGAPATPTSLFRITPTGDVSPAADDLLSPNGMALSADERTLTLAESGGGRLVQFDVEDDGTLTRRRILAEPEAAPGARFAPPDGICTDAEGGVWMADPLGGRVLRVDADGATTDVLDVGVPIAFACALGGADRRTLFACVGIERSKPQWSGVGTGTIIATTVAIPGAGKP